MQQEKNILVNRGIPRSTSSPFGFGFSGGSVPNRDHWDRAYDAVDHAIDWLIDSNEATEKLYTENLHNITYITDTELAKTRAAVIAVVPPDTDTLEIESRTLRLQLSKARNDHQEHIAIANLYYGHDPLTHPAQDSRLQGFELLGRRGGRTAYYDAIAKWKVSYAAAYEAKFLAEQIRLMDARLASIDHAIAEAKKAQAVAAANALLGQGPWPKLNVRRNEHGWRQRHSAWQRLPQLTLKPRPKPNAQLKSRHARQPKPRFNVRPRHKQHAQSWLVAHSCCRARQPQSARYSPSPAATWPQARQQPWPSRLRYAPPSRRLSKSSPQRPARQSAALRHCFIPRNWATAICMP